MEKKKRKTVALFLDRSRETMWNKSEKRRKRGGKKKEGPILYRSGPCKYAEPIRGKKKEGKKIAAQSVCNAV